MLQQKAENPSHEDGGKERRQRHANGGDEQRQLIEKLGVEHCRQNADYQTQHHRNGDGHRCQQQSIRESLTQNVGDLSFALVRHPQIRGFQHDGRRANGCKLGITANLFQLLLSFRDIVERNWDQVIQIIDILLPKTLVEAQLLTNGIHRLLVGALAEHHLGRVARQDVE